MSVDPSAERFEQPVMVLPGDIDVFGHVNNVVYVRWVQDISTAHWLSAATDTERDTIGWVVKRHEIDYLYPVRPDDEIVALTWVGVAQKHVFERHVEFVRVADQKLVARARSLWCPIDMRSRRLMRVNPETLRRWSVSQGQP